MLRLAALKAGDVVDIIAPGYGAKIEDVRAAVEYVESLGLVARVADDLLGDDLLSSADDATRLRLVGEAFFVDDSRAVWAIKGGYGTSEIVPKLAALEAPKNAKWLIGFSDITALHNLVHGWGWPSLHAPVLWQIARQKVDEASVLATQDVLFGRVDEMRYDVAALNQAAINSISVQSSVVGGNMMLLQCSIGTNWQPKLAGAILFLEDIDETAYRVARVLHHMKQAGWFAKISAVVFGDFSYIERKDDAPKTDQVIAEFCEEISVPAYRVAGIGHKKTNMPLPLNTAAKIEDGVLVVCV